MKFDRLVTGTKAWDYNVDGLATVGLLPDFTHDLMKLGVGPDDLQPFFMSAESYVFMWECIENESMRLLQRCQRLMKMAP